MADPCGAKTRSGCACKTKAMKNGRCRMHGGTSTGPKNPNSANNAVKHGIYCKNFTDEENEIFSGLTLGSVDEELKLCRIRLRRALAAEELAAGEVELDETITRGTGVASQDKDVQKLNRAINQAFAPYEEKRKVKDYNGIIDRLMQRIESLEKTRSALLASAKGDGDISDDITRDDTTIAPDEPIPYAPIL